MLVSHFIHVNGKIYHHHHHDTTVEKGQNNLAFVALVQLGQVERCVDLLIETGRAPEAALFARTYAPRSVSLSPQKNTHIHFLIHSFISIAKCTMQSCHGKPNFNRKTGQKWQMR